MNTDLQKKYSTQTKGVMRNESSGDVAEFRRPSLFDGGSFGGATPGASAGKEGAMRAVELSKKLHSQAPLSFGRISAELPGDRKASQSPRDQFAVGRPGDLAEAKISMLRRGLLEE